MNRAKWALAGIVALVLVWVGLTLLRSEKKQLPAEEDVKASVSQGGGRPRAIVSGASGEMAHGGMRPGSNGVARTQAGGTRTVSAGAAKRSGPSSARSPVAALAVAGWETLVDQLVELTDAPAKERKDQVKKAFDALDPADQMDAIHRGLNLLPDAQFDSLCGILFDKTENVHVLDAIFSDALNRPDEIKIPIMKALVTDKQHPMFFESARILDVTGELGSPAEGEQAVTVEEPMVPEPAPPEEKLPAP